MSGFYLLYQPKVKDNVIVALEALLRPKDAKKKLSDYLSEISDYVSFDLMIINHCLDDINSFNVKVPVSINIHPESVKDNFFISNAIKILDDRDITLELVEHQEIELTNLFVNNLKQLKTNGIKISIDDFGKDFARTDIALAIGADEVKFDRSLINGIDVNYSKFKHLSFLYNKIQTLCSSRIVFEGVENKRQKNLIELFAESPTIQGFYYYKPMFLNEIIELNEFKNEYYNENKSKSLIFKLDYLLYNYIVDNNIDDLDDEGVNQFVKKNDVLGLIYNSNAKSTLENLRSVYFSRSSVVGNGALSLISSAEEIVIIRNSEGVVIYDNEAHQKLIGKSLVGISPHKIVEKNNDYSFYLEKDRQLLQDKNTKVKKNNEFFKGVEYKIVREKIIYNNRSFVITTVTSLENGV